MKQHRDLYIVGYYDEDLVYQTTPIRAYTPQEAVDIIRRNRDNPDVWQVFKAISNWV